MPASSSPSADQEVVQQNGPRVPNCWQIDFWQLQQIPVSFSGKTLLVPTLRFAELADA
jgi:hypothetical protein